MPEVRPDSATTALGLSHDAFVRAWKAGGLGKAERATLLYKAFFREGAGGLHALAATADELGAFAAPGTPSGVLRSDSPEGEVIKFLLDVPGAKALRAAAAPGTAGDAGARLAVLAGGAGEPPLKPAPLQTESVVIPMKRRHETTFTLCVSSQVGCAMGCTFCETAQMGLIRSLTAAEIVGQWWAATHHLGAQIRNIVFMGMGEPLDNLDSVLGAIEVLTDNRGPAIGMSRITVSTVGKLDGLARLREAVQRPGWKQLNLAVSVNAPNDDVRSAIMPINRGMPLGELIPMLETWPRRKSGAICVEYVLIPGVNDAPEHAAELAARFKGVRCCVNVIPYNPRRNSPWPAPQEEDVSRFLADLEAAGQFCKRRRTKGRDTMAACGQLGNEQIRGRKLVGGAT